MQAWGLRDYAKGIATLLETVLFFPDLSGEPFRTLSYVKAPPVETPYFLPVGFRGIELFKVEGLGPKCYKYRAMWKSTPKRSSGRLTTTL